MPQVLHESSQTWGEFYLWHVEEEASFFENALVQVGLDVEHIRAWHPSRQREWLSGRYLVHQYSGEPITSLKVNEHGKPSFGDDKKTISISHTADLVGLQVHTSGHGLDLQIDTDKVGRVARKYCNEEDLSAFEPYFKQRAAEHYIWGLKESVYKAYGKKGLSYMNDITIKSIAPKGKVFLASIQLKRGPISFSYQGKLSRIGPYYICQVIEI